MTDHQTKANKTDATQRLEWLLSCHRRFSLDVAETAITSPMTAYLGASITFVIGAILLTPFGYSFWQMSFRDAAIMTANKQRVEAAMSSRLTGEGFLQNGPDGRPTGFSAIQSSAYVSPALLNGIGEAWTLIHRRSIGIIGLSAVVALFGCLAVSCFMPTRNLNASVVHDGNKVILQWHEK